MKSTERYMLDNDIYAPLLAYLLVRHGIHLREVSLQIIRPGIINQPVLLITTFMVVSIS